MLVQVVDFIRRRQDFGFINVIDTDRFEHLPLDKVADARLRHHRNRHSLLDLLNHRRVGHARDAAVLANIRRHAFERHDGDGASLFGDARLFDVHDVHDDTPLQHLRSRRATRTGGRQSLAPLVSIQFAHTEAPVESRQPRGAARDDEFDRSMRATTPSEVRRARGRRFIASRRRVTVRRARSRDARARIVRATSRGAAALATRARATSRDDASERRARERAETNE